MKRSITSIIQSQYLTLFSFFIIFLIQASFTSPVLATDTNKSVFDAMAYEDVIDIKVTSDFENLRTNRRFEDTQEGVLTFEDENKTLQEFNVNLSIRGRFRRMFSKDIPPLKIDFGKKELKSSGYNKYDDLKLVTYFYEDKKLSKEILLKEYLTYKLYNVISGNSYRVQLVNLEMVDINTGKKDKQMAFLIEDSAQLSERIGAKKMEDINAVNKEDFHKIQTQITSLFQYMIGNSDWSPETGKNIKLFEKQGKIICVPYDFDFSGLVDAPYAVPDNTKNLKSVKDRIYLGFDDNLEDLTKVIRLFEIKREKLLSVIDQTRKLSYEGRSEVIKYIEGFFLELEEKQEQNLELIKAYAKI